MNANTTSFSTRYACAPGDLGIGQWGDGSIRGRRILAGFFLCASVLIRALSFSLARPHSLVNRRSIRRRRRDIRDRVSGRVGIATGKAGEERGALVLGHFGQSVEQHALVGPIRIEPDAP